MDPTDHKITINLRTQDGGNKAFKMGRDTPMARLLKKHCDLIDIDYRAVELLIKGERFDHKKTPAQLKLKDGCVIEAFVHSDGGGPKRI